MSDLDPDVPVLINCLTEDVNVLIDGDLVALPRGITPILLDMPALPSEMDVAVLAEDGTSRRASIRLYALDEPMGILDMPPVLPGVWNLVDEEAIRQFPWREDFVTPAMWAYDIDESFSDAMDDSLDERRYLVGVTRAIPAVATPDMRILEWAAPPAPGT